MNTKFLLSRFCLCAALGTTLVSVAHAQNNPPQFPGFPFDPPTETAPEETVPSTTTPTVTYAQVVPPIIGAPDTGGAWTEFLSGRVAPLEEKFADIKSGWYSLNVVNAPATNANETRPQPVYPDPFFRDLLQRFGGDGPMAFTQGRTVRLNNDVFLIVYRAQFPDAQNTEAFFKERFAANSEPTLNQALGALRAWLDTATLRASLLNTRNVNAIENVTPFNFETQFAPVATRVAADMKQSQSRRTNAAQAPSPAPATAVGATRKQNTPNIIIVPPQPKTVMPPKTVTAAPKVVVIAPKLTPTQQMRTLYSAFTTWLEDNDGVLPPLENLTVAQRALTPYLKSASTWKLSDGTQVLTNARVSKRRYAQLQPYKSALILFYSTPDKLGTRTVLRLDGQVKRVKAAEWKALRAAARLP